VPLQQPFLADGPMWTDVGLFGATVATVVAAAVAAIFAARAFRLQNEQVKEQRQQLKKLTKQQALTDRLLAYQAHTYARSLISGVELDWGSTDHPGRRRIRLGNQSQTAIADLSIDASLGGIPCMLVAPLQDLMDPGPGASLAFPRWAPVGELTIENCFGPIGPHMGREWTVHADNAPIDAELKLSLRFTDELGGRWTINEDGHARLQDEQDVGTP
jgi:hypothetical protein